MKRKVPSAHNRKAKKVSVLTKGDIAVIKFTENFIKRYRKALEALAKNNE